MKLENMFKKTRSGSARKGYISLRERRPEVPEGLLRKCNKCGSAIIAEDVKRGYYICPKCGGYFRVHAYRRIEMIADDGTFEEWDKDLVGANPMDYKGYPEKLAAVQEKTKLKEAIVTGKAEINGLETVIGVCDGRFLMSSMGEAVGEKIARAVERATKERLPVILFACSGGARMQEGITSLMQMAKTSAAIKRHSDAGLLYISVLTDPTTGGVTASFAMLGDVILAEPKALIGFAGPRVIEQTIGQKLPKGFQRSEFLLEHGFIDRIVEREEMKTVLSEILQMHQKTGAPRREKRDMQPERPEAETAAGEEEDELSAWDRVQISRMKDRPVGSDYIQTLFTDFMEFHGDRYFADDKAIIGGIARFHGQPVTVIAQAKGTTTKENIERNFGMPSPDGYRKALRLMKQAEKFGRPVICFVDTPGAFCGLEAEERGQGEAIARNIYEMSGLRVPVLSIIIGEGGSGGALAMATADEVWMLENSIYSILSPEGFASILWKDSTKAKEAAGVMKLTAHDLYRAGIVEKVFPEPSHYTVLNLEEVTNRISESIDEFLEKYESMSAEELTQRRYERFRRM
ncbi:acetyl-CoA carboxylase carboxyltransferase subunit alpha [Faecalicatena contorta]|uniref:Multifunctional fusion protein n=1 Tax=Faecalicatena fissicatena TaxID=290055 RepID=A0ABS2EBZ4_9FIRM|nr:MULTISPECIES: acetyl-CoA carboxylase carboxyltransferase subunit alpha [Clostridia]MBM6686484.1 acetyl-CoA carboxylase carboxyltransferase subunit alpha [Faecalicatena contorta]MBM6710732.1 acetyl-CoA carboxylase carboxyltransferase subunit alpha [Faecalicatena contorta]MBM6739101.1 acetyl-CoA carboxylase carboxyltransferase subunit alpha [Faecalicatena fissicatena]HIX98929.1 acetyl-CoA carboxylase carboxyltransferase subunit alpha [Candidatus Dorea intestinigallinarum]